MDEDIQTVRENLQQALNTKYGVLMGGEPAYQIYLTGSNTGEITVTLYSTDSDRHGHMIPRDVADCVEENIPKGVSWKFDMNLEIYDQPVIDVEPISERLQEEITDNFGEAYEISLGLNEETGDMVDFSIWENLKHDGEEIRNYHPPREVLDFAFKKLREELPDSGINLDSRVTSSETASNIDGWDGP